MVHDMVVDGHPLEGVDVLQAEGDAGADIALPGGTEWLQLVFVIEPRNV